MEYVEEIADAFEWDAIQDSHKSARGNMAAAARTLGTTPRIIGYKVERYDINPKRYSS